MKIAPNRLLTNDSNLVLQREKPSSKIIKISGVIIVVFMVVILQAIQTSDVEFSIMFTFFNVIIVYSAYIGSLTYGLISAAIAAGYTSYFYIYYLPNYFGHRHMIPDLSMIIINFFFIAAIVGIMNIKLTRNYKKLIKSQRAQAQAEKFAFIMASHIGLKGEILKPHPALSRILGYSEDEMLKLNISDISYPRDYRIEAKKINKLINGEIKSFEFEKRFITKDGKVVWMYINPSVVKDDTGSPSYLLTYMRDISERKKTERELHEKEKVLKTILNTTNDGILVVNNDGHITHYNELFKKMWGISREDETEVMSDNIKLQKFVAKKVKNPNEFERRMEYLLRDPEEAMDILDFNDGRVIERYSAPLMTDNDMVGRVWTFRDITKSIKIQEELHKTGEQYRKLIEFMPAGVFLHTEGKVVFANEAMAKLLRTDSPLDFIGTDIMRLIHPEYHEIARNRIMKMQIEQEDAPLIEEKFITFDGGTISLEVTGTHFNYEGKPASLIVAQDVYQRKKAEEMERKAEENKRLLDEAIYYDKLKTEFFANISHELRTPLNVIFGALQLLEMYMRNNLIVDKGDNLNKYSKIMKQNCYRLLRLVNNLIDITKIDSGYFLLQMKNYDIVSIVEDITLSVVEYAKNKDIEIIFDTDTEEKMMACDPDKIERIILNLLANAVKFTKPGGWIRVNLYDIDENVIISVKDNGIGIPEDKLDIIFERFRQVDKSLTRDHEGSGIGLSLVKSLVEMHGGNISVKSSPGLGSEFILTLPVKVLPSYEEEIQSSNDEHNYVETIKIEFSDIYS